MGGAVFLYILVGFFFILFDSLLFSTLLCFSTEVISHPAGVIEDLLHLPPLAESLSGEIQTVVGVVAVPWVKLPSTTSGADIVGTKISSEMEVQVRAL